MKKNLSRRDFLKYSCAASVGAASLFALTSCTDKGTDKDAIDNNSLTEIPNEDENLVESSDNEIITTEVIETSYVRPSLVVGGTDPGSIPPYSPNQGGRIVIWEMYEVLFEQAYFGADMSPVLCDKSRGEFGGYDHESGTCIYTFYIYDYITDAQGNPITADDVVFSFQNYVGQGGSIKEYVGCRAVDKTTIEFEFEQELLEIGELDTDINSAFIYSQKAYEESGDQLTMSACGTGRYELVDFIGGNSITLKKRDNYWQTDESLIGANQQANVGELRIDFISETAQKVIALQLGSVDMVESLDTEYVSEFENDSRYQVYSYKDNLTWYILFNCSDDSPCKDVNLRLAIANAIDVDGMLTALGEGFGARAYVFGNDNFGDYNPEWEKLDNYNTKHGAGDADQIESLLNKAGYSGETLTILAGTTVGADKVLTIIQSQCLKYGINLYIKQLDSAALSVERSDSTAWDIDMENAASKGFIASIWGGGWLSGKSTSSGESYGFIHDDTLEELTSQALLVSGHTSENMDALWNHIVENCYVMGLFSKYLNMILPAELKSLVFNGKKWMIHTACVYEAV